MSKIQGRQDLATVPKKSTFTWTQRIVLNILRSGPMPKHVAFIMDGNRRYAKQRGIPRTLGHSKGYDKFDDAFRWCKELGMKEVTVYAFSIENFKRDEEEVQSLMDLFQERFQKILDNREKYMSDGICFRVIGNLTLLPAALRKVAAEVTLYFKDNNKIILNIALAYTAREEMANAVKLAVSGVANGKLSTSDITQDLLQNMFYSRKSLTPDLVVRTSGEVRLSDFLLWQASCSCIYFCSALWPEYSAWDLIRALLYYQRSHCAMVHVQQLEKQADEFSTTKIRSEKVHSFIQHANEMHQNYLSQDAVVKTIV